MKTDEESVFCRCCGCFLAEVEMLNTNRSFYPLFFSLSILFTLSACGTKYVEEEVKDYRISLETRDPTMDAVFAGFVERYNNEIGFQALNIVSEQAAANSQLILTVGLKNRDNKIGWGQWIKTIEEERPSNAFDTDKAIRKISYSMRVEFDDTYMRERARIDASEEQKIENFRLFAHEVGHGLMMDHIPTTTSVMYEKVLPGKPDYTDYYKRAREFFGTK